MPGRAGQAVTNAAVTITGQSPIRAIYAVPILGFLLVLLSDDLWKFNQAWISLSFLFYAVLLGVVVTIQMPAMRDLRALAIAAGGADRQEITEPDSLSNPLFTNLQELKASTPVIHGAQRVLVQLEGITLDEAYGMLLQASRLTGRTVSDLAEEVLETGQRPAQVRQGDIQLAESPEMEALRRKATIAGGVVNLLWVMVLCLMVFKPGL